MILANADTCSKQFLFIFRGHPVFYSEDSLERFVRVSGHDYSCFTSFLRKAVAYLFSTKRVNRFERYIFKSQKYGFGIHLDWGLCEKCENFGGISLTTLSRREMGIFEDQWKKCYLNDSLPSCSSDNLQERLIHLAVKNFTLFSDNESYGAELEQLASIFEYNTYFYDFDIVELDDLRDLSYPRIEDEDSLLLLLLNSYKFSVNPACE